MGAYAICWWQKKTSRASLWSATNRMWLAKFVCAPQFFKTPKGLSGHTVCYTQSLETLQQTHLPVEPLAYKVYAETDYYCWLVLADTLVVRHRLQKKKNPTAISTTILHPHLTDKVTCRFSIMPHHQFNDSRSGHCFCGSNIFVPPDQWNAVLLSWGKMTLETWNELESIKCDMVQQRTYTLNFSV
jgi:hypothetical protein